MPDIYSQYVLDVKGEDLITAVREVAAASPDFSYLKYNNRNECQYFNYETTENMYGKITTGQPSCILGQALWRLGYTHTILPEGRYDSYNYLGSMINTREFDAFAKFFHMDLEPEEIQWLLDVQTGQDTGETWGQAVEGADKHAAN